MDLTGRSCPRNCLYSWDCLLRLEASGYEPVSERNEFWFRVISRCIYDPRAVRRVLQKHLRVTQVPVLPKANERRPTLGNRFSFARRRSWVRYL